MKLLLKTSTPTCELTLVDESGERHDYSWQADRQLAKGLLEFLRDHLNKHQADFSDLTGIGVFRGPGSFTGLRIGLTVANTLASSLDIPIVGATDESWRAECLDRLDSGQNERIVMPEYGGEANITKPRK